MKKVCIVTPEEEKYSTEKQMPQIKLNLHDSQVDSPLLHLSSLRKLFQNFTFNVEEEDSVSASVSKKQSEGDQGNTAMILESNSNMPSMASSMRDFKITVNNVPTVALFPPSEKGDKNQLENVQILAQFEKHGFIR